MKKEEKILRIRPFNMANFSGAGGYIPVFAIFGGLVSFPATLALWSGMASQVVNEDGTLNAALLKRRLARILLPLGLVSLILWFAIVIDQISQYGGNLVGAMIATVFVVALHIGGMYISIYFSGKLVSRSGQLTKGKWFLLTLTFSIMMLIVGIIAPIFLFAIAI